MKKLLHTIAKALVAFFITLGFGLHVMVGATPPPAKPQKTYKVAWSHYTGWEVWDYLGNSGILAKHAKKHGVDIKVELVNDYVNSINLYTSGNYIACAMTNMDALTIPAVGGVDSTVLIIGDFSNGNDGIVVQKGSSLRDLKGKKVLLVELTVSHYMLARALEIEKTGLTEKDMKLVNTTDSAIAATFNTAPDDTAVVTWNPMLLDARNKKGAKLVFDSAKIPGEIMDLLVVRTDAPDGVKKALVGAWYEAMAVMSGQGKGTDEAIAHMAKSAGGTLAEFQAQLKTTRMFYDPKEAAEFARSPKLRETMDYVRTFSFEHGLFGNNSTSKDAVGIEFADKSVLGNSKNVKLRFDPTYTELAGAGRL
jgi:NitT/TauT family transport system substrate-binding protein